jgi:hypothetical protein
MVRILLYALPILLAIYALIDCIQTDESEIRGLPKIAWVVLIVLIWVVGPIAWLVAGRTRTGRSVFPGLPRPGGRSGGPAAAPPRQIAPDDDPEFLGQLGSHNSYDRLLEEWEQELRNRPDPPAPAPGGEDPPEEGPPDDGVPAR